MKCLGVGFGRTGTLSLQSALNDLGAGPCFHMLDLIQGENKERDLPYWDRIAAGEKVDWHEVFDGWESTVDWPGCTWWEEMAETWPEAPILLSVRDPEAWYRSTVNSIHEAKEMALRGELQGNTEEAPDPAVMQMINGLIWNGTFKGRFTDKEFALEVFRRHNEDVKSKVSADRLLVYEIKQGWGPLCDFLGVDVPDEPMPHLNDTESFRNMWGMPALTA